jgi:preprotein translocase subunit SecB
MATQEKQQEQYKQHAIQLVALKVLELSIKANPNIEDPHSQHIGEADFTLGTGYSKYDDQEHKIGVKIFAEIGEDNKAAPFALRVELVGIFDVDEGRFPIIHIEHWAKNNAPFVLYSYLREQVYGLTSRAGFPGTLLPLFEIPTFKITMEQKVAPVDG